MLTKQDVFDFMQKNGLTPSDKVMVHSSLRAIGPIENGADGLLDAMSAYLSEGLLIIPTHTWVEVRSTYPYYDVRTSVPCIGTLAKVAAFRKDAVRSLHPTHSVAVFGKKAFEYVQGEELSTSPVTPGRCVSRLYEENGKILLIGVGHERNTFLHSVEERLDIPNRINSVPFQPVITDWNGRVVQSPPYHMHKTVGLPKHLSEYYPNMKKAFEQTGAVTYGQLGNALVYVCDAHRMQDVFIKAWSRADYDICSVDKDVPEEYYMD